jgi:hypothetical protein
VNLRGKTCAAAFDHLMDLEEMVQMLVIESE